MKNFKDKDLPYELLVATRQSIKIFKPIANNMSTDIKLGKN